MNVKSIGPAIKSFRVTDEGIIRDLDEMDETCTDEALFDIHSPNYRGDTGWGMMPGSPDRFLDSGCLSFLEQSPFEIAFQMHFGRSWQAYNIRRKQRERKSLVKKAKPKTKTEEDRWVM